MNVHIENAFVLCVANIFNEAGYSVEKDVRFKDELYRIDIVAKNDNKKYLIEVKYSHISENVIRQICWLAAKYEMEPMVVTAYPVDDKKRKGYEETYPGLILIDIANLLFEVRNNSELRNELLSTLPYTINDIEQKEGSISLSHIQHDDYTNSLIQEMNLCQAGREMFKTYEELCHKLLKNVLSEELALWKEQKNSNRGLYRFDLLCRIKDGNQKTFWSIIERHFNSKYVVFEFKNYKEPITQKEIYTTERYLYAKALRSVAIIISANGYDDNARWAATGCFRENGKLIMLLETSDLIKMNEMKARHDDPSDFLLDKLDDLLSELEK